MACIKRHKIFCISNFIKDEDGFTTLSVVVSLLVSLSLIFSSAQVYRLTSESASIQNIADASSQAAENQVAEFMILVKLSDAVILSLGLAGITTTALSVVAMCTPVTAEISKSLLDFSYKIFKSRDKFADKASNVLNNIQKSLVFLSTVKAYEVAKSNNGGIFDNNYISIALLMPGEGVEIKPGNIDSVKDVANEVSDNADDIRDSAKQAEEAAQKINEIKIRAFMADCGSNPNYCMYERAKNKAYMNGAENPLYKSADTWSFKVPLERSKAYYKKRLEIEKPESSSVEECSNSALRKVFYQFASDQMKEAYVNDDSDTFSAYFPHLPKNTDEMKSTCMYTSVGFPVSSDNCIHAYKECPACSKANAYGTLSDMDSGAYNKCETCDFSSSSLGKVAAASSTIDNGYEYHYSIVENAAKEYQEESQKAAPVNSKIKNFANDVFSKLKEQIRNIVNKRIYAKPPGAYGAIALTVNTSSAMASKGFESSFVHSDTRLGVRAAVSAATIIEENSDEGKNVMTSFLDGLSTNLPHATGAANIVLGAWSKLLMVYCQGQDAFVQSLESAINQLPLISASGLGTWAAKALKIFFQDIGLEPVNLNALKPVLINSYYVGKAEELEDPNTLSGSASKSFAVNYLVIKEKACEYSQLSNSVLQALSNDRELAKVLNLDELIYDGGEIEIACIEPLGELGPSIPIKIKLPKFAQNTMANLISWLSGSLQSIFEAMWDGKVWR